MATDVQDDKRLLGSRRLAAATDVIKTGAPSDEESKLLGSRRLRQATKIIFTTPRDQKRILGSKRLKEARLILFNKAAQTTKSASEEKRLLGSKRLNRVREVLVQGVTEIRNTRTGSAIEVAVPPPAPEPEETHTQPKSKPAAPVASSPPAPAATVAVAAAPKAGGPVDYCGQKPTEAQVKDIATVRSYLSALSQEDKEDLSPWIDRLTDVDIYRYLLGFGDAASAWGKIKDTAKWRKAEKIDTILSEDLSDVFEAGKEEMVYLPVDKKGRPILLYRSALHTPNKIDPVRYTRYVIQQTERAIEQYGIGTTAESVVLVDRIGSGLKNQDPALLRVLIPVILNHYPYTVGAVYVAPTSSVFNVIWSVLKLLLTADAQKRFVLINKGTLAETLKETIPDDVLPQNLGGSLDVGKWFVERRELDEASEKLSQLDELMNMEEGEKNLDRQLVWAGKEATEEELLTIAAVRVNIADLSAEQKSELGPWIMQLRNEDILRFVRRDETSERTWAALQATSKWRKENKIDDILNEDLSSLMPDKGEEFYYTGLDNQKRPIVVYRSCLHTPGRVDPEQYNRYVIKTLEQGRVDYGLGYKCQAAVVVDRVGSGLKNQDPALLRVLLPCFTTHFPGVIGNIYIAPVNNIFYAIWSLVSLLLDADTRSSVKLLKKESKTEQLLEDMDASVIPKNLGGQLSVPQAGIP